MFAQSKWHGRPSALILMAIAAVALLTACVVPGGAAPPAESTLVLVEPVEQAAEPYDSADEPAAQADVSFTLVTAIDDTGLVFVGQGGAIDNVVNPDLRVEPGQVVEIVLVNGDGMLHDVVLPDFDAASQQQMGVGERDSITFRVGETGLYPYYCSVPGHREAGMEGRLIVGDAAGQEGATGVDVVRRPADLPPPIGDRAPQTVQVELEAVELEGQLADGATYTYWTFDGHVPGPFIRLRVGDTVAVTLRNRADSQMVHSVDLHAVTGPGGGAAVTQTGPGEASGFTFQALNPGLYVYHCATPMHAHHVANGMYGLILVEPEEGLVPVDREFYVMQGELYTQQSFGSRGQLTFDGAKLLAEAPEYILFNGAVGALTELAPLEAQVGETVRIFFGVGGPNLTSSFHVIGEIFDRVYDQASVTALPLTDVQTTLVPAGGATVVEFELEVPGRYVLVDHALSRLERGLVGYLLVDGPSNPDIFMPHR